MKLRIIMVLCTYSLSAIGSGKVAYRFSIDPIDVVIPCHSKDMRTLERVIKGIKDNIDHRRIVIVSQERLTENAEWFDEKKYPFTKRDLAFEIFQDEIKASMYLANPESRIGWLYQQFLKFYAPFVIPNISSNVLIIDADTIFVNKTEFLQADGAPLFAVGTEYHKPYFHWMNRLIPGLKRMFPKYSGITNHMLFQKVVLDDLFATIEAVHKKTAWKAMCHAISRGDLFGAGLSEYELYFNFIFTRSNQPKVRPLRWDYMPYRIFLTIDESQYDFVTCHAYME